MIKQILNPDIFHGYKKGKIFFEGWYFKLISKYGDIIVIIPGIFKSADEVNNYSFIQIFYGNNAELKYIKFPFSDFNASTKYFCITINENCFSLEKLILNINSNNMQLKANLNFRNIKKWPDSIINPGSMGFYNYLTFMECYSQVCAVNGEIQGTAMFNNKVIDFTDGRLYIEKNWGTRFPSSYIWAQCNSFTRADISLTCSIGNIPMLFSSFTGFLIGLQYSNNFYKFTTINKSQLGLCFEDNTIRIQVRNKSYQLELKFNYPEDKFVLLYAPTMDGMIPRAKETLLASIEMILYDMSSEKILLKEKSDICGLEFSGDYKGLIIN